MAESNEIEKNKKKNKAGSSLENNERTNSLSEKEEKRTGDNQSRVGKKMKGILKDILGE